MNKHIESHMYPEERALEKARRDLEAPPEKFLCQECGSSLSSLGKNPQQINAG